MAHGREGVVWQLGRKKEDLTQEQRDRMGSEEGL